MANIIRILADVVRFLLCITRPISDILLSITYRLFLGDTKPLPPIADKLLLLPAVELAAKIRKREIKCVDVVQAYVERAQLVQPITNAITGGRYKEALQDAKKIDEFLDKNKKSIEEIAKETPLLGVPFSCKEAAGVKDMAQAFGLLKYKDRKAERDSEAAAQYRKAGAIPLCVTNVPELAMWWATWNNAFGDVNNPYDNTRIAGGSSGGEASLITAAGSVIGIGTDTGGSIRMPSSFCGIYGHKPTSGVVSNRGEYFKTEQEVESMKPLFSTGPMCRYAKDLPLLFRVLSDNDSRIQYDKKVDFGKIKIYYMEQLPGLLYSAVPDVKNAVRKAVDYFDKEFNNKAIPLYLTELRYAFEILDCRLLECYPHPLKNALTDGKGSINVYWEILKCAFGRSEYTLPVLYFSAIQKLEKDPSFYKMKKIWEELSDKFETMLTKEDAILLMPTHQEVAPNALTTIPKFPNVGYTCIWNTLGFPSTQIPAGMSENVPFGIQAVSGKFKDHMTIATALELDKLFGGWKSPCQIHVP